MGPSPRRSVDIHESKVVHEDLPLISASNDNKCWVLRNRRCWCLEEIDAAGATMFTSQSSYSYTRIL